MREGVRVISETAPFIYLKFQKYIPIHIFFTRNANLLIYMYLFFVGITEKEISKVFSNWSNFPGQFHRHYVWYTSLWSNRICLWKRGLFILTIWCFSYIFFPEFGTKTYGKKSFWRLVSSNTNIGRISSRLQTSHDAGTNVAHCVGLSIWLTLISHLFPFNTDMWRSGKSREKIPFRVKCEGPYTMYHEYLI